MPDFLPSIASLEAFGLLVLGFGFVILVHELGHFLVAKAVGIKVLQFAVGFGPAVTAWRKGIGFRVGSTEPELRRRAIKHLKNKEAPSADAGKADAGPREYSELQISEAAAALGLGETEYRLNYVPLGGYVKMLGQEDLDPNARSEDARAYNRKPVWARMCVISAGVTMNLIFALIFFVVVFLHGIERQPARVGAVRPESPAATTYADGHQGVKEYLGLKPDDDIVAIDGAPTTEFTNLMMAGALGSTDRPVVLTIRRQGVGLTYRVAPAKSPDTGLLAFGIGPATSTRLRKTDKIAEWPDYLTAHGVKPEMEIISVDGTPVNKSYARFADLVFAAQGRAVEVAFQAKDGAAAEAPLHAVALGVRSPDTGMSHLLGLVPPLGALHVGGKGPAATAGMKAGDAIVACNAVAYPLIYQAGLKEVINQVGDAIKAADGGLVRVTVLRDGRRIDLKPVKAEKGLLNFTPGLADLPVIAGVLPTAPPALRDLNLPPGTRMVTVNDQPVATFTDLQRFLQLAAESDVAAVKLGYVLPFPETAAAAQTTAEAPPSAATRPAGVASPRVFVVTVPLTKDLRQELASAGWDFAPTEAMAFSKTENVLVPVFEYNRFILKAANPLDAARMGVTQTKQFMAQTYVTLAGLFRGSVPVKELRGFVGIGQIGTQTARDGGFFYLLYFLGIISVNLVVINFLPIPVVDGGHMLFLLIEKIKGSPVPIKVQAIATYAGLALILGVMLMTFWFDIGRLIGS